MAVLASLKTSYVMEESCYLNTREAIILFKAGQAKAYAQWFWIILLILVQMVMFGSVLVTKCENALKNS